MRKYHLQLAGTTCESFWGALCQPRNNMYRQKNRTYPQGTLDAVLQVEGEIKNHQCQGRARRHHGKIVPSILPTNAHLASMMHIETTETTVIFNIGTSSHCFNQPKSGFRDRFQECAKIPGAEPIVWSCENYHLLMTNIMPWKITIFNR